MHSRHFSLLIILFDFLGIGRSIDCKGSALKIELIRLESFEGLYCWFDFLLRFLNLFLSVNLFLNFWLLILIEGIYGRVFMETRAGVIFAYKSKTLFYWMLILGAARGSFSWILIESVLFKIGGSPKLLNLSYSGTWELGGTYYYDWQTCG